MRIQLEAPKPQIEVKTLKLNLKLNRGFCLLIENHRQLFSQKNSELIQTYSCEK